MCCSFCEEPLRSVTLGLAAVGIVALIKYGISLWRKHVTAHTVAPCCQAEQASDSARPAP